jgi:hypothetical protein
MQTRRTANEAAVVRDGSWGNDRGGARVVSQQQPSRQPEQQSGPAGGAVVPHRYPPFNGAANRVSFALAVASLYIGLADPGSASSIGR